MAKIHPKRPLVMAHETLEQPICVSKSMHALVVNQ